MCLFCGSILGFQDPVLIIFKANSFESSMINFYLSNQEFQMF